MYVSSAATAAFIRLIVCLKYSNFLLNCSFSLCLSGCQHYPVFHMVLGYSVSFTVYMDNLLALPVDLKIRDIPCSYRKTKGLLVLSNTQQLFLILNSYF